MRGTFSVCRKPDSGALLWRVGSGAARQAVGGRGRDRTAAELPPNKPQDLRAGVRAQSEPGHELGRQAGPDSRGCRGCAGEDSRTESSLPLLGRRGGGTCFIRRRSIFWMKASSQGERRTGLFSASNTLTTQHRPKAIKFHNV